MRWFILAFFLVACSSPRSEPVRAASVALEAGPDGGATPPNILMVMWDDLDERSFDKLLVAGFLPRHQAVLDSGMRFTESFVSDSVCCPSRVTFMTGQYPWCHGVFHNTIPYEQWDTWDAANTSLAVRLQSQGYFTIVYGKWRTNYKFPNHSAPLGWDRWHVSDSGLPYRMYRDPRSPDQYAPPGILTHPYGSGREYVPEGVHAVDWIADKLATDIATMPEPFFAWFTPAIPHTEGTYLAGGYTTREGLIEQRVRPAVRHFGTLREPGMLEDCTLCEHMPAGYVVPDEDSPLPGWLPPSASLPHFDEADISDKMWWLNEGPLPHHGEWPPMDSVAYANTRRLALDRYEVMRTGDDALGTLIDALDARGILDRTIVVVTSDNGFTLGEHRRSGHKLSFYEEDIRVPFLISGPGVIQGSTSVPILNTDWPFTLADFAGTTMAQGDGRSFRSVCETGQAPSQWRRQAAIVHWFDIVQRPSGSVAITGIPDYRALRTFDAHAAAPGWLYAETWGLGSDYPFTGGRITDWEMYDLAADPYQITSLRDAQAVEPSDGSDQPLTRTRDLLRAQLRFLTECSGDSCRALEE